MNVKILIVAGLLGMVLIASDAFAWSSGRGGSGGGDTSSSVTAFNGGSEGASNGYTGPVSVPEPSSLYAIGSALTLAGAMGWALRRRK
jgi:hypothetical protein